MNKESLQYREYLGDGLYVGFDGYHIVLFTEREDGTHYVGLEPSVMQALKDYEITLIASLKNTPN